VILVEPVAGWLRSVVGEFEELERRSAATRIRTAEGALWLKRYASGRAWVQSERAFGVVVPALARSGFSVPLTRAKDRGLRLRVLSEVPGRSVTMHDPPEVFRDAARVLHRLSRVPCAQDPLPLGEAMLQRARAWAMRSSAPRVAAAIVAWVADHAAALDAVRVWCHRDFHPRNWLHDGTTIGLLDFEHTRPDHPLVDWVRLEADGLSTAQRAALVDVLGEPDPDALRGTLAVYGLATWVWAQEHRDVERTRVGRQALQRSGFPP